MRRFHSPLLKIQAVYEQQRRLAEIELSRALSRQREAEEHVQASHDAWEASRQMVASLLRQSVNASMLSGAQMQIVVAQETLEQARTQLQEAAQAVLAARTIYQGFNSKVDGLTKVLDEQRAEYRQDVMKDEQIVMDDRAGFRWKPTTSVHSEGTRHG